MKTDKLVQELIDSYGNWMSGEAARPCGGERQFSQDLYPYDQLFSPITINRLKIKNRIVMGPMGNISMAEETGRPNQKMLEYFFARAKGGVGLITTGLVPVTHGIDNSVTELDKLSYFPRIDRSRTVLAGWRDLAQGCHAYGARIFIQLTAGLGRVGNPECLIKQHKFPVSASWNPNYYMPQIPCRPLTDRQIKKIVKNLGQGAADAKHCGLDGVYLHGHEGYLIDQLTNPAFNRRKLGRYADWQRFGLDTIREIRRRTGPNYPIMYRIDLSLALNECYGERMKVVPALRKFRSGRTLEDSLNYMAKLVEAGVDLFDVDLGCYDNWWLPHPPEGMPAGCFVDLAKLTKDYFKARGIKTNAGHEVPVVAVGKLGYPDYAEQVLRDDKADMVMLARPLLADDLWCQKAYAGKVDEIRPCIGCQEACINEFVEGGHPQCAVNPRTGFEHIFPDQAPISQKLKRIGVVGGGPAGMVFALYATQRGHQVDLYEQGPELGGRLIAGSVPKIKFDVRNYLEYLRHRISKSRVQLHLNTRVEPEELKEMAYDVLVFACGTQDIWPAFTGSDQAQAIQATDLLCNPQKADRAENIVIVGGGVVGVETAYWLAYEYNKQVSILELQPEIMKGVCTANRGHLLHYLERKQVAIYNCSKVVGLGPNSVEFERQTSKYVPDPYITWTPLLPDNVENPLAKKPGPEFERQTIAADLIVLAMGGKSADQSFNRAQEIRAAEAIYNLADSFQPGRVAEATRAAYRLAISL